MRINKITNFIIEYTAGNLKKTDNYPYFLLKIQLWNYKKKSNIETLQIKNGLTEALY